MQEVDSRCVWTVTVDHFETGAGRTFIALFCWASSEQEAKDRLAEKYAPFWARLATASPGVDRNNETLKRFFSPVALETVNNLAAERAHIDIHSYFHFNFS